GGRLRRAAGSGRRHRRGFSIGRGLARCALGPPTHSGEMMRALLCTGYGRPPTIEMGMVNEPALQSGEVRVAVEAVGLGYFDGVLLSGRYQERPDLPFVVGRELAGTVIEVASDMDPSLVGRHVAAASLTGACAERVAVAEAHCLWLP